MCFDIAGMSLFSSFFILLLILVQSSPPTSASISRLGKFIPGVIAFYIQTG